MSEEEYRTSGMADDVYEALVKLLRDEDKEIERQKRNKGR